MPLTLFHRQRPQPDSRAVPIVLGVTGHRDVRDTDLSRLHNAVAAVFETFSRHYRHTPLVLLSSLAQGADQLCAMVALEKGLQVIAPLPFPAAIYRQSSSFDNDEARREFEALLHDPRVTSFVVPLPEEEMPTDEAGWTKLLEAPDTRHRCYANAGGYVVLHCHALIALWDGAASDASAGTAQMVQFKRTGRPPGAYPWTQPLLHWADSGPVYVVHTPRASAPAARRPAAGHRSILYPTYTHAEDAHGARPAPTATQEKHEKRQFKALCHSINRFNRRLHTHPQPLAQDVVARLLGEDPPPALDSLSRLALLREAAAGLARPSADRVRQLTATVFGLIGLAAVAFHLYAHHFKIDGDHTLHTPLYLWAFIGLLLGTLGIVCVVWYRHLERQTLDYRALAEALRVQIYWVAAGIDRSVADSYLQQAHSEMSWVRQAVRPCTLGLDACCEAFMQLAAEQQLTWLRTVGDYWLAGQCDYYHRQYTANHHGYTRYRRWGLSLAGLGWLLALTLVAGDLMPEVADRVLTAVNTVTQAVGQSWLSPTPSVTVPDSHAAADGLRSWSASQPPHLLLILSGTLAVAGGLCIAYSERRAFEALARQYNRMSVLFAQSIEALQFWLDHEDVAAAQRVLMATGYEALTENASWLILRRARPFELPVH